MARYKVKLGLDLKGKQLVKSLTEMLGANDTSPYEMHDLTKLMSSLLFSYSRRSAVSFSVVICLHLSFGNVL